MSFMVWLSPLVYIDNKEKSKWHNFQIIESSKDQDSSCRAVAKSKMVESKQS